VCKLMRPKQGSNLRFVLLSLTCASSLFLSSRSLVIVTSQLKEGSNLVHNRNQSLHDFMMRHDVSTESVSDVVEICADGGSCLDSVIRLEERALDGLASFFRSAKRQKHLVIGVIGDSVATGCCSTYHGGFSSSLQFYINSILMNFGHFDDVIIRNVARGACGPRFHLYCNDIRGDEHIVIYETVKPGEADAVLKHAAILRQQGAAVILVQWKAQLNMKLNQSNDEFGFTAAAKQLALPLVILNENIERYKQCVPNRLSEATRNGTKDDLGVLSDVFFKDEIHPNSWGHLLITCSIANIMEKAWKLSLSDVVLKTSISGNHVESFVAPTCYDNIECVNMSSRCLHVSRHEGFTKRTISQNGNTDKKKSWWEGTEPGQWIELWIPQPSTDIMLFMNQRPSNGMVEAAVDGEVIGVIDGYMEALWWLPREKGHLVDRMVVKNLTRTSHFLRLTILNQTNSETGIYKFDFVALAVSSFGL